MVYESARHARHCAADTIPCSGRANCPANTDPRADQYAHADFDRDGNGYAHANRNAHDHTKRDRLTHCHSDKDAELDQHEFSKSDGERDPDRDAHGDPNTDANANRPAKFDPDTDAHRDAEPDKCAGGGDGRGDDYTGASPLAERRTKCDRNSYADSNTDSNCHPHTDADEHARAVSRNNDLLESGQACQISFLFRHWDAPRILPIRRASRQF